MFECVHVSLGLPCHPSLNGVFGKKRLKSPQIQADDMGHVEFIKAFILT